MPLAEKFRSGKFVVLGEFEPPKGSDFSSLLKNARRVKGRLEALVVPEMANGVMKASSLGGCAFLQRQGFDTVMQICCRDRNRLAIQADILSAAALGITNIMAVAGEEIRYGDHPQGRSVNDLNLLELVAALDKLQHGRDLAGIELTGKPAFCVGSTLDTSAPGGLLEIELEDLNKKIDLGVQFVITNPVFDVRPLQQVLKRIDTSRVAVIPTVLLLKSAGMARYIDRNVKGISVPAEMIRGIQKAPDRVKECIQIAAESVARIKDLGMAGVMLSTLGWEDRLPDVLSRAGL